MRNGTLAGVDVRDDTLTGADVRESTLQTVPSANTAHRADAADTAGRADHAQSANIAVPEGFHEIGAGGEPSVNPGCANTFSTQLQVGFYKDRERVVHLKGSYTCTNSGAPAFNLPPRYRPPSGEIHAQARVIDGDQCPDSLTAAVNAFGAGVVPGADGAVTAVATEVSLDGVSSRAAG